MTLEQIIDIICKDGNREKVEENLMRNDAFVNSVDGKYKFIGKFYPATYWSPAEYPDVELDDDCYAVYLGCAVEAVLDLDEFIKCTDDVKALVEANIIEIMDECDINNFLEETEFYDKAVEYAYANPYEDYAEYDDMY